MPMTGRDLSRARPPCHLSLERQMTIPPIPRRDFYVYALFRTDGQTPFYIGKGRGNRINIHEKNAHRETSHKDRIIQGMHARGEIVGKRFLVDGLTDPEAKQIESILIQLIGRWPAGPLANLTSGGDGVANLAPESRAKKSAANVASWQNPDVREARSLGMKSVWTPEKRAAHSAKKLASITPETRLKMSLARSAYWKNRERIPQSEESRAKKSRAMIEAWTDPNIREKRSEASKKHQNRPEYKAKRSVLAKAAWARRKAQKTLPSGNGSPSQPPP
jgi:hypothetical protein